MQGRRLRQSCSKFGLARCHIGVARLFFLMDRLETKVKETRFASITGVVSSPGGLPRWTR